MHRVPVAPSCTVVFIVLCWSTSTFGAETTVNHDHAERMQRGLELFRDSVRLTLTRHCVECHGAKNSEGGLNRSTRAGLLAGGDSGPAIVSGRPAESRLLRLVTHRAQPQMPFDRPKLSASQIEALHAWIENEAPYSEALVGDAIVGEQLVITDLDRRFWSFLPLVLGNHWFGVRRKTAKRNYYTVEATQRLDDIAIAVLDGQVIRAGAWANRLSPRQVEAIVNQYCRRANPVAFRALQPGRYFVDLRVSELRLHRHRFLPCRPASEPITPSDSVWCLPGVPTVTLGGFYDGGIDTIDDLVRTPMKTLSRLPKVGPEGLRKTTAALRSLGFAEPGHALGSSQARPARPARPRAA